MIEQKVVVWIKEVDKCEEKPYRNGAYIFDTVTWFMCLLTIGFSLISK